MKVDLKNRSHISDQKILKLIEFCRPKNGKLCKIIVKNSSDNTVSYDCGFHYFVDYNKTPPYIIFRINRDIKFPMKYEMTARKRKKNGYLGSYEFSNFTECLVYLFSHEFHHQYMFQNPKTRTLYYNDSKKIERLADLFALRKLKKYRQLKAAGIDPLTITN